ncbi:MAG: DUF1598 domain-containing protein [Planctomycetota bacterium]
MLLAVQCSFRLCLPALLCVIVGSATAHAQFGGNFGGRSVGGVIVDADGMVRAAEIAERDGLKRTLNELIDGPQGDLREQADRRMISLKGLQAQILESHRMGQGLPEEAWLLGGLQGIDYVFVDQQNGDIVLAGPAEPWEVRDGSFVGKISGGACLRLDDLMVAMQSVEAARQAGISCSIEPTEEGRLKLRQLLGKVTLRKGQNPAYLEPAMKQAFGPQRVLLTGIPTDSHFARTMLSADFQMKRLAMQLTESPIAELPSYLQLSKNARSRGNENPRWWIACQFDALKRSEDRTAWKIEGLGVQTMTEQDLVEKDGSVKRGKGTNKLAQQWADRMTENYVELAERMPVFGELRNLMDVTLVATLIRQERLDVEAGLDLSLMSQPNEAVELASYPTPSAVEPHCSFVRGSAGWTVTASGGVEISAFQLIEDQVVAPEIAQTRQQSLSRGDSVRWWWNG